jgi:uncharacterized membrane protein/1-acyl-sn-glycerol-3-phosphate acyltransferase
MRASRLAWALYSGYVVALLFGVGGIAIALQRPDLWAHLELGRSVYSFGMRWGGVGYIVLGAAALFVYAWSTIGPRRTLTFFLLSVTISLSAELIGTSTGWPFGNYSYTSGLGYKILDRVPFTIPFSWFTVGLASYLLALRLRRYLPRRGSSWPPVLTGVWLLVVWDLVLDPAMAHEAMQARFWVWHQTGSYFGMPFINFAGWALTGMAFTTASRWAWRAEPVLRSASFPYAIYAANILFASALCATVGLWGPIALAFVAGLLPATLALVTNDSTRVGTRRADQQEPEPVVERISWLVLRTLARLTLRRPIVFRTAQRLPTGPTILAAQHVHHLDDGRALLAIIDRPVRFLVALDWVPDRRWRRVMELLCRTAGWPTIVRPREIDRPGQVYSPREAHRLLVGGLREAVRRVAAGQLLVVFPEGYPLVDPHLPARRSENDRLAPGAVWIARAAAARAGSPVSVFPVQLETTGSPIVVTIGEPMVVTSQTDVGWATRQLEVILRASQPLALPSDDRLATQLAGEER